MTKLKFKSCNKPQADIPLYLACFLLSVKFLNRDKIDKSIYTSILQLNQISNDQVLLKEKFILKNIPLSVFSEELIIVILEWLLLRIVP